MRLFLNSDISISETFHSSRFGEHGNGVLFEVSTLSGGPQTGDARKKSGASYQSAVGGWPEAAEPPGGEETGVAQRRLKR